MKTKLPPGSLLITLAAGTDENRLADRPCGEMKFNTPPFDRLRAGKRVPKEKVL